MHPHAASAAAQPGMAAMHRHPPPRPAIHTK
jgi:hypothetical protein